MVVVPGASTGSDVLERWGQDVFQHLGRAEDAGHAGAGVGAGADEVEVGDVLAPVVEAEVGRLGERRLDGEAGAVQGVQVVAEMLGGDVEIGDEVLAQAGQDLVAPGGRGSGRGSVGPVVFQSTSPWRLGTGQRT